MYVAKYRNRNLSVQGETYELRGFPNSQQQGHVGRYKHRQRCCCHAV